MTEYKLYLESGPKMRTTMVHVLELLGCVASGPTTEAALDATEGEIRRFLWFLKEHGDKVNPDGPFKTTIAQHVMEGPWIGYGNPAPGFEPDFQPLTRKELATHMRRLGWMGQEIAAIARKLSPGELDAKPAKGRPIGEIIRHLGTANADYVRVAGLGKPEGMKELVRSIGETTVGLAENLQRMYELTVKRFEAATEKELTQEIQRGTSVYTARRGLRRSLEHAWEHLREIERRLGS